MAYEDFTTYTEVDDGGRITVTSSRVTFVDYGDELGRVFKDKGSGYFDGDFTHDLDINIGSDITNVYIWQLANEVDTGTEIWAGTRNSLMLRGSGAAVGEGNIPLIIREDVAGESPSITAYITIQKNVTYYIRLVRDESIGTFGTLYLYVYTDSAHTNLLDSKSLTLRAKTDFRYVYVLNQWSAGGIGLHSGYVENLLLEVTLPAVTTQAVTNISGTTATGNGTITNLGAPVATQHGHVWNTAGTPVLTDNKTENGVPILGAYTSSITGLTAGTKYYVRAYVTNDGGTSYGNEVVFWADKGTVWPIETITRVTGIIHRYNRAKQVYSMEVNLGGVTTDFGIPQWTEKPQTVISTRSDTPLTEGDIDDILYRVESNARLTEFLRTHRWTGEPIEPVPSTENPFIQAVVESPVVENPFTKVLWDTLTKTFPDWFRSIFGGK